MVGTSVRIKTAPAYRADISHSTFTSPRLFGGPCVSGHGQYYARYPG